MPRFARRSAMVLGLLFAATASAQEDAASDSARSPVRVPYRLTDTHHILVRAKINGAGPFNFILDTGAPALFVSTDLARKADLEVEEGWTRVQRFTIEGGAELNGVRARVEDPFQLVGMNALGLSGAQLDGVIGYNVAARFRINIDLARRYMLWTRLDYEPPGSYDLTGLFGDDSPSDSAMGALAQLAKMGTELLKSLGGGPGSPSRPRAYLGIEVEPGVEGPRVKKVHEKSPAARAGVRAGDIVTGVNGRRVSTLDELFDAASNLAPGDEGIINVRRANRALTFTFVAARGL